jgi:hypothetical protein
VSAGIRRLVQERAQVRCRDLGDHNNVDCAFEHPGQSTFPVSVFVVKRGGMIVICAGTTGYNLTMDARYLWMHQKRVQGSHFANLMQASQANKLASSGASIRACGRCFPGTRSPRRTCACCATSTSRATCRCSCPRRPLARGLMRTCSKPASVCAAARPFVAGPVFRGGGAVVSLARPLSPHRGEHPRLGGKFSRNPLSHRRVALEAIKLARCYAAEEMRIVQSGADREDLLAAYRTCLRKFLKKWCRPPLAARTGYFSLPSAFRRATALSAAVCAVSALPVKSVILDGDLVAVDIKGKPVFYELPAAVAARPSRVTARLVYFAFSATTYAAHR